MAIVLVQSAKGSVAAGLSVSATFPGNVTAGNSIIAVAVGTGTDSGFAEPTITDTLANVYTVLASNDKRDFQAAPVVTGGACTITASAWGFTGPAPLDLIIFEYSGIANPALAGAVFNNPSSAGTTISTGSIGAFIGGPFIVLAAALDASQNGLTWTSGGSYPIIQHTVNPAPQSVCAAQLLTAGTGPFTNTFGGLTNGDVRWAGIAAFIEGPPVITCGSPPSGVMGVPYTHTFPVYGGVLPYTFAIISGSLPTGLTLNATTGVVSGTPIAGGTFTFNVRVTDAAAVQAHVNGCSITIAAPPPPAKIYRDVDFSGTAAAINGIYEVSYAPGSTDESMTLHDYHGMHMRASGSGAIAMIAYGLDRVRSVVPLASPFALSASPGIEVLIKWFLRSEQQSIRFSTNAVDSYFILALVRAYYQGSLPQR